MGVELTTLEIDTRIKNLEQTVAGLDAIKTHGKGADDSFGSLALRIAGFTSLANLAVSSAQRLGRGIMDLGKESIVLAAGFEKARVTWGVLVGDMDKGAAVFDQIRDFAEKTPLSFEGLNQAATTIKGFGVATEDLIPTLSKLGDVAMGDNQRLQQLALVYGQVMAQGKAKTQDLYQFINAGVPIFNLLAQSMGVASGKIKDLAAEGAITFQEIDKAIAMATTSGGQFAGMMEKTSQTTMGKWSTAVDNFKASLADLGERVLPLVNKLLDDYNSKAQHAASSHATWTFMTTGQGSASEAMAYLSAELTAREAELKAAMAVSSTWDIISLQQRIALINEQMEKVRGKISASDRARGKAAPKTTTATPSVVADDPEYLEALASLASFSGTQWKSTMTSTISAGQNAIEVNEDLARVYEDLDEKITMLNRTGIDYLTYEDDLYAAQVRNAGGSEADVAAIQAKINAYRDLAEQQEAVARLEEGMSRIGQVFASAGMESWITAFETIGESLASGSFNADSFADSMANLGEQVLSSLPMILLQVGLQAMMNPATFWAGLALVGASGLVAIGSGIFNAATGSSDDTENAKGGVYSSPSLHSYANRVYDTPQRFAFARGAAFGWEGTQAFARGGVFAEAGPEAIMPLRRGADGRLGVSGSGGAVSIQVVNNLGVESTAQVTETTGADGSRQLQVTLEKAVTAVIASGKADSAMKRYGVSAQGRRVV